MWSRCDARQSRRMDFRRRGVPWLIFLLTLFSAWPLGAMVAAATPATPDDCEGIGFGCSLHEWNAARFLLLILGVPYAVCLAAVLGVLSLHARWLRAQTFVAVVGLAAPWMFTVGLVAETQ